MKKVQLILAIAIIFSLSANAQRGGGNPQMLKQHLIDSLHFTPAKADSTVSVHQQFQMQMRQLRMDTANKAGKGQQMKALHDQEHARLASFLTPDELSKFEQFEMNMMHHQPMPMRATNMKPAPAPGGN
jgi:hypothetical protein